MGNESTSFSDWSVLKRILRLAIPYKSLFIWSVLLAILLAPLGALRPYLVNQMVDDYILKFDRSGLINMTLILLGVLILQVVCRYAFIYMTNLLGQSVICDLRTSVFKHILSLRMRYFDQTPIGTSTTRTINDVESINQVFTQGVITIFADIVGIIAVLGMMLFTSVRLTLICLLTMPLMILATYIFKEKVKVAFQKVRTQISQMNAFLQERITGMNVVQVFNAQEKERQTFKEINHKYTQANLDSILYYALFYPAVEIISALSLALMVWWGASGVVAGKLTFGALVAFPIYLSMLFRPLRMLADKFNTLQMGMVAGNRVFNVLDLDNKIEDSGKISGEQLKGKISFENVHFAYDGENEVLSDINFTLEAGQTLAIVGQTGSGKSSIINVLNRFYAIQKGDVKIDDKSFKDYDLKFLRSRIGLILQDVFLFSGTIMDNLRIMDEEVDPKFVIEQAKLIDAHDMIMAMPGGYDFQVAERGLNMSLGQRQILSFVRFLVFHPDIFIMDEATSSIDLETEAIIQKAIENIIENRTSIIIAHRLSTIRKADVVAVLDKGKLVEFGPQADLLHDENSKFRKLVDKQLAESEFI